MQEAIKLLRARGEIINEEDVAKLSTLLSKHINILGKYSFVLPESVRDGKLRELDNENFP